VRGKDAENGGSDDGAEEEDATQPEDQREEH
jgi:hypothetical protein